MKKKENKQLTFTIFAVLLLIAIIGGSTYAYWSWQTSTDQQTLVDVTVRGGTLTIVGQNVTNTSTSSNTQSGYSLYPTNVSTNGCNPSSNPAVLKGSATVTATNQTGTDMRVTLLLKASLTKAQGTLSTANRSYLKWAVVETTPGIAAAAATSSTVACVNTAVVSASGTFKDVGTNTDLTTNITWIAHRNNLTAASTTMSTATKTVTLDTDGTTYNSVPCISFTGYPEVQLCQNPPLPVDTAITTRTYDVYVWLDSGYTYTSIGDTVNNDPMQDLSVTMTWSTSSTMVQIAE